MFSHHSMCVNLYLQQLSVIPWSTNQSIHVSTQQEEQQHQYHEEPGEEETEPCAPVTTFRLRCLKSASRSYMWTVWGLSLSAHITHIMRKMPPQSEVQERLVGSTLGERPRGPIIRPRMLLATTRRTRQHRATPTLHLRVNVTILNQYLFHVSSVYWICLNFHSFYLISSALFTFGKNSLMSLCTCFRVCDTSVKADRLSSWENCKICVFIASSCCLLSKNTKAKKIRTSHEAHSFA